MQRRQSWRTFWNAFLLTLCVLGLAISFFVIEYNTRRVSSGTVDFGVRYTMEDGCPRVQLNGEQQLYLRMEDSYLGRVMLTPSVKLLLSLWRWQTMGISEMLAQWELFV